MEAVVRQERRDLLETAALLRANGFTIDVLSGGTSFSGKMPELLDGITEIRSGDKACIADVVVGGYRGINNSALLDSVAIMSNAADTAYAVAGR